MFAPHLNSGKSNELRKSVYRSCFFQSLFPLIVHFFSQLFQRLSQFCLCCCFSCSNLYSTIINNWSLLPPAPTKEKIKLQHNQLFKSSLLFKGWPSFSRLYDQLLRKTALLDILIWLVGCQNFRKFTCNWKFRVLRGSQWWSGGRGRLGPHLSHALQSGCTKTSVRLSGTGRNLVRTCKPLTWLVMG